MALSAQSQKTVHLIWLILKYTYGLLFVIAGADKFMNLVTQWDKYVSPMVISFLPSFLQLHQFMLAVGIIEIVIGLITLFMSTRMGALMVAGWLVIIVVNLLSMGLYFDIAVRDLVMAVGAICLALLSQVVEKDQITA